MTQTYTIRELTKEFAVTARTLRFYEAEGLLAPERRGQARIYSEHDRRQLNLILRGRRVGFSLAEIRELLDPHGGDVGGLPQVELSRAKCVQRMQALESQKKDIDAAMDQLQRGLEMLDARIDALRSGAAATAPALDFDMAS